MTGLGYINVTKACPYCGEEVVISGHLTLTDTGFTFRSDEAGNRAAWAHQDKHNTSSTVEVTLD